MAKGVLRPQFSMRPLLLAPLIWTLLLTPAHAETCREINARPVSKMNAKEFEAWRICQSLALEVGKAVPQVPDEAATPNPIPEKVAPEKEKPSFNFLAFIVGFGLGIGAAFAGVLAADSR